MSSNAGRARERDRGRAREERRRSANDPLSPQSREGEDRWEHAETFKHYAHSPRNLCCPHTQVPVLTLSASASGRTGCSLRRPTLLLGSRLPTAWPALHCRVLAACWWWEREEMVVERQPAAQWVSVLGARRSLSPKDLEFLATVEDQPQPHTTPRTQPLGLLTLPSFKLPGVCSPPSFLLNAWVLGAFLLRAFPVCLPLASAQQNRSVHLTRYW